MTLPHTSNPSFNPNLDVLRSLAVSLVVAQHLLSFSGLPFRYIFPLGHLGVLLFFLHTSLVLMLSLERNGGRVKAFYVRRFFRIYPLSVVAVLVVVALTIPGTVGEMREDRFDVFTGSAIVSSLLLVTNLTGDVPVLGQLWTLPYEVQMYLVLPALFFFARRVAFTGSVVLWVATVVFALTWGDAPSLVRIPEFVPHFVAGVIAYTQSTRPPSVRGGWWFPFLFLAVALGWALPHAVPSAFALGKYLLTFGLALSIHRFRPVPVWSKAAFLVATYSYGLYLWHTPAIWLGFSAWEGPFVAQALVVAAALVALPVTSYHLIEAPMIRLGARLSAPEKALPPSTLAEANVPALPPVDSIR